MDLPFGVVDADGHLVENHARIREHMESPYSSYLLDNVPDKKGRVGHGSALTNIGPPDANMGRFGSVGPPGYPFPQDWLEMLDRGGMEMTFLFPTSLLDYSSIIDPDYVVALCRAYNDWVAEDWLGVSPRLRAVSLPPLCDVDEAVKELRRTIMELGFSSVMVSALGFGALGDRKYDPFYEEAQRLNCLIAVHGGTTDQFMRFPKFIQRHVASFPVSNILQVVNMTLEGVFERFPNLRVGYLETGCTWVPYFLDRMDEEWEKRGEFEAPDCKRKPSEYLKGDNVFFHTEPSETLIPQVVDILGENSLFYASDWPHWDNEYPENIQHIWERQDLSESAKRAILSDNARRMYGVSAAT